jgi:hypothetical protein
MKSSGVSGNHQNNCLKVAIAFAKFLGPHTKGSRGLAVISFEDCAADFLDICLSSANTFVFSIWW